MKSISYKILAAFVTVLFFGRCIDFTKDHTRFKGRVIEANNLSLDSVKLVFISGKSEFLDYRIIRIDTVNLFSDGDFEFTINSRDEGINTIGITLAVEKDDNSRDAALDFELYNCFPYDCKDFEIGKKYEFNITVTLPQED